MINIVLIGVCILLLLNLVIAMTIMGYRTRGNSWLLAVLLTGTTGAAVVAIIAVIIAEEAVRFVDLSLVLMGLAALPVVIRVMLTKSAKLAEDGGERAD